MTNRKIITWILGIIAVLSLIVVVGVYLVLRSSGFQRYLITKIEEQVNQATGGQVEIQKLDLHLSSLSTDAYGIVIHGTENAPRHPLLSIDKLSLKLKIASLIQHKIDLNEIVVQHPVVHFFSYRNGQSNLPQPRVTKKQSKPVNVFDVGIQHVLLSNGEIYYNQERMPLTAAELHDLRTEIKHASENSQYEGSISYRGGKLQLGKAKSLPHSLDASFTATPSQFSLTPAVLRLGASQVRLKANVSDFGNPKLEGSYQIRIHTPDFQPLLASSSLPAGDIDVSGSVRYQNEPGQAFLHNVVLAGRLDSREVTIVSPQLNTTLRAMHGDYQLANGDLHASNIGADLLGGHLRAEILMLGTDATPVSHFRLAVHAISLRTAREVARSVQLKQVPITGRIDGTAEATWTGSLRTLKARSDLTLKGTIAQNSSTADPIQVPVDGVVHANYDGSHNQIVLRNASLRTPQSLVDIHGILSNRSDLRLQARSTDLHELSNLAAALQSASTESTGRSTSPKTLNISGAAVLTAQVEGSMADPRLTGQVTSQNLQAAGGQWRSLQFELQATSSAVSVQHGTLIGARQGQAFFSATVGLREWKYSPSNPIAANLSVRQMPLAQLEELANVNYPVVGNLSAELTLRGSQSNPIGTGAAQITKARIYGQTVQNLSLNFHAVGDTINSALDFRTPAGGANAKLLFYPKTKDYELQLNIPGINLAQLDAVQQKSLPVSGTLTASATGKGSLDDPQLIATVEIPHLQVRDTSVKGVKAQVSVANNHANLALDSQLLDSFVQARGTVDLRGSGYYEASLDTQGLPLGKLIALYKPVPPQFQGELEFHASAKGPLKDKTRMQAHLVIPTLRAAYEQIQIANAGPIKVDYAHSIVSIASSEIRGTDSDLHFQGEIPLEGSSRPRMSVVGALDMQLLRIFSPDVQSSGKVALDLRATSSETSKLGVQGQVRLRDVSVSTATAPLGVENLNGLFDVQNNQVRITQLTGQSGGGQISGGGVVTYAPQVQFNVPLNAKGVRLRYPEGVRTVLDSNLTLSGTTQNAALNGRVLIDSLGLTPDFDFANFIGQFTGNPTPPTGEGFAQNLKLNVALQSTSQLSLANPQLSLQGQANLRVVGTAADPVIVGRTNFTGGDLFFQNKRFTLQRGIVDFINPNETEPVVNMVVTTTVEQYNLTLTFLGPIDHLRTSYTSDPPLPPVDVINLLARGQTTEESTPGNMSANSVLAQGLAGQASSRIQKLAGISSLQIDPTLGGNGTDPTARVAIQQRVTKNFIFTFSTDVTNPEGEIVQGEYQLTKRWSVSATRDQYGGVAVDGKFRKTF
jgi:translocation and assembly module TamB